MVSHSVSVTIDLKLLLDMNEEATLNRIKIRTQNSFNYSTLFAPFLKKEITQSHIICFPVPEVWVSQHDRCPLGWRHTRWPSACLQGFCVTSRSPPPHSPRMSVTLCPQGSGRRRSSPLPPSPSSTVYLPWWRFLIQFGKMGASSYPCSAWWGVSFIWPSLTCLAYFDSALSHRIKYLCTSVM